MRKMLKSEREALAAMPPAQARAYKSLWEDYARLSKKADARLRALEGASHWPRFKKILHFAYKKAKKAIEVWSPPPKGAKHWNPRFDTAAPPTLEGLRSKMADIQAFLNAPSSTKSGIIAINKKRLASLHKNFTFSDEVSWQDMADFWASEMMDQFNPNEYNSDVVFYSIGVFKKNKDLSNEELKDMITNNPLKTLSDDEVLDEKVKQLIKLGYDYKTILGKK